MRKNTNSGKIKNEKQGRGMENDVNIKFSKNTFIFKSNYKHSIYILLEIFSHLTMYHNFPKSLNILTYNMIC